MVVGWIVFATLPAVDQCVKKKQPTMTGFADTRTSPGSISVCGLSGITGTPSIQVSGLKWITWSAAPAAMSKESVAMWPLGNSLPCGSGRRNSISRMLSVSLDFDSFAWTSSFTRRERYASSTRLYFNAPCGYLTRARSVATLAAPGFLPNSTGMLTSLPGWPITFDKVKVKSVSRAGTSSAASWASAGNDKQVTAARIRTTKHLIRLVIASPSCCEARSRRGLQAAIHHLAAHDRGVDRNVADLVHRDGQEVSA